MNSYISCEQAIVSDDHLVTNLAIVTKVNTDHQEVVIPDASDGSVGSTAVDRAVFAQDIVVADFYSGFPTWVE